METNKTYYEKACYRLSRWKRFWKLFIYFTTGGCQPGVMSRRGEGLIGIALTVYSEKITRIALDENRNYRNASRTWGGRDGTRNGSEIISRLTGRGGGERKLFRTDGVRFFLFFFFEKSTRRTLGTTAIQHERGVRTHAVKRDFSRAGKTFVGIAVIINRRYPRKTVIYIYSYIFFFLHNVITKKIRSLSVFSGCFSSTAVHRK